MLFLEPGMVKCEFKCDQCDQCDPLKKSQYGQSDMHDCTSHNHLYCKAIYFRENQIKLYYIIMYIIEKFNFWGMINNKEPCLALQSHMS